ncbi:conserved hypothetical protein [Ricinus communis]|uniref:Uncharacterized protein n=1 Tax=Ricinus communis TaxID=3988 RepID=B9T4F0_RICCO|nr:conserved hypothetical protein [Ricinus communis]
MAKTLVGCLAKLIFELLCKYPKCDFWCINDIYPVDNDAVGKSLQAEPSDDFVLSSSDDFISDPSASANPENNIYVDVYLANLVNDTTTHAG